MVSKYETGTLEDRISDFIVLLPFVCMATSFAMLFIAALSIAANPRQPDLPQQPHVTNYESKGEDMKTWYAVNSWTLRPKPIEVKSTTKNFLILPGDRKIRKLTYTTSHYENLDEAIAAIRSQLKAEVHQLELNLESARAKLALFNERYPVDDE